MPLVSKMIKKALEGSFIGFMAGMGLATAMLPFGDRWSLFEVTIVASSLITAVLFCWEERPWRRSAPATTGNDESADEGTARRSE